MFKPEEIDILQATVRLIWSPVSTTSQREVAFIFLYVTCTGLYSHWWCVCVCVYSSRQSESALHSLIEVWLALSSWVEAVTSRLCPHNIRRTYFVLFWLATEKTYCVFKFSRDSAASDLQYSEHPLELLQQIADGACWRYKLDTAPLTAFLQL